MAAEPLTAVLNIGGQLIDRLWPDQEKKDQAKLALMEMAQKGELTELTVRGEIVKADMVELKQDMKDGFTKLESMVNLIYKKIDSKADK